MSDLIRAELLKLRTTRTFWWSVVAALAFVPVSIALAMQMAGQAGSPTPVLDSSEGVRNVMSAAASGAQILLVIGILIMAGEFRHNTATSTFLISPDRKRVVGAKLAAASLVGVGVTVAASVLTLAIALPWLAAKHIDISLLSGDVAVPLLGALAATALYPLVGVGIGALLRNQTVAVTIALVWVLIVEGVLVGFAPAVGRWLPGQGAAGTAGEPAVGRWLPGGAGSALTGVATAKGGLLPMWGAALLLAGYGLAFAAAGTRLIMRRDIT